ncbi:PREDICTED: agamous-like MADS-box protein AGL62 isoform X1 [Brassica oleracea var. oleracea]|uniref:MADS-box domain-containing protein n=1 Tax=Brassica oleracea var. oleracea TaxID=109376 RepID=A0A0D3C2M4_BRAOL|nr:PREDICTED: agamous-like MADS-box protein AGL62 isoform X1 [Brassica oleracea var. oleracea]
MARSRKGRRKIQIVKMEKDSDLQVTYSKRRQGLFKKASELCTLCGVEIGILVFSPGRKVFSFGNPDVRYVFNRFKIYHQNPFQLTEFGPSATIRDLNSILSQELVKLEKEKARRKILEKIRIQREETDKWWEKPPSELNLRQNACLVSVLENLRMNLGSPRFQQAMVPQNYCGGSNNNIVGGGNTDPLDERSMFDVNAFNYNPNMMIPNQGPMLGYNNIKFEVFDPIYNMNWPEYKHGPY